jgi:NADH:ubiquinone oxidoreductase subunit D
MKYLLSLCLGLLLCSAAAKAQDTLQQYTGKYKFPAGSVVADVEVTQGENGLVMASSAGSSPLRHEKGDEFTITAFSGLALFTRNAQGKIAGVHIEAMGYVMDGTKEDAPAFAWQRQRLAGVCQRMGR